jgi:hypothetical protein
MLGEHSYHLKIPSDHANHQYDKGQHGRMWKELGRSQVCWQYVLEGACMIASIRTIPRPNAIEFVLGDF